MNGWVVTFNILCVMDWNNEIKVDIPKSHT